MSRKPRHAAMAEKFKPLMAYRSRPEGPIVPVRSNWRTEAANDNNPEDLAGLYTERRAAIRPTVKEIEKAIEGVIYELVPVADFDKKKGEHETVLHPVDGDIERNKMGQIIRLGKLRFSDGTQTERAYKVREGALVEYDALMPVGAMLGTQDRQERVLGGDMVVSNAGYTQAYGGKYPNKVKRKSKEARAAEEAAPVRSKSEMRAELAALPAHRVTVCKAGFPWQPANLRDLFMGLEKGKKGESGSIAWEDVTTHLIEREAWAEALAALPKQDVETLDAAMTASSVADLGGDGHERTRERRGKARLIEANDNFSAEMKKIAA